MEKEIEYSPYYRYMANQSRSILMFSEDSECAHGELDWIRGCKD